MITKQTICNSVEMTFGKFIQVQLIFQIYEDNFDPIITGKKRFIIEITDDIDQKISEINDNISASNETHISVNDTNMIKTYFAMLKS